MRLRPGTDRAISVPTAQQCRVRPDQNDKERERQHECVLDRSGDEPASRSYDGVSAVAVELYLRRRSANSCQRSNVSTAELE